MAPLLIPTRNRPTSLSNVLRYLARFYPATQVIVADGSDDELKIRNRQGIEAIKGSLAVDYRPYAADIMLFDRILDVLRSETSKYVIMGSDDDYPMMDTLSIGEQFLEQHAAFSVALGALIHLRLNSPTDLFAWFGQAVPVQADDAVARARRFAQWHFATTYAVTSREALIERYTRARKQFLIGFYDFAIGIYDCLQGKIKALPDIGFICTRNYGHSYVRMGTNLIYLRKSRDVLEIVDQIRRDLIKYGGLDEHAASAESERLIMIRIAELAGRPAHYLKGFENWPAYKNAIVQGQLKVFDDIFDEGTAVRKRYEDRLAFILAAIKENALAGDNQGERGTYETLEEQLADRGRNSGY